MIVYKSRRNRQAHFIVAKGDVINTYHQNKQTRCHDTVLITGSKDSATSVHAPPPNTRYQDQRSIGACNTPRLRALLSYATSNTPVESAPPPPWAPLPAPRVHGVTICSSIDPSTLLLLRYLSPSNAASWILTRARSSPITSVVGLTSTTYRYMYVLLSVGGQMKRVRAYDSHSIRLVRYISAGILFYLFSARAYGTGTGTQGSNTPQAKESQRYTAKPAFTPKSSRPPLPRHEIP